MIARLISLAAFAVLLALGVVAPASAQTLLDDILPQQPGGVCTCATMSPPFDCDAAISDANQVANQQRRQFRAQCATDWRAQCDERYGWQACNTSDAQQQLDAFCDNAAVQWSAQATSQIAEIRRQCTAANAPWIEHCETVERPASCETCNQESARIVELEREIADANAWLTSMRNGEALISADDEALIAQRLEEVERWERELSSKRTSFQMLQDTDFCPRP